ncbi:cellulose biosynthesis cyclic di-GMP-binding regulatory protein BcsB [Aureimonas sp. AU4]|uniref:cellulose biosynthesis cyclic di-GMP-binding regulatory protein BcsB n=1 Tax=Aureimonas sp. AU4 TaxID=1638163 RepID=UPI0009E91825|nr:cellulose biosynthesis cyclic di-GMP-binding regulatory protein BcsB [Aureimonas sp. AU4]
MPVASCRRATSALAILASVAASAPALAEGAPAFDMGASPRPNTAVTSSASSADLSLARLQASARDLFLGGENPHRSFPVFVTTEQSTKSAKLTLSYTSAVSVAPETSSLVVLVNGETVLDRPLKVGEIQEVDVPLTVGLLTPGYNAVQILVRQFHRVDCSVPGTYELWTQFDPRRSGLSFGPGAGEVHDVSDLPALQPGDTGRVSLQGVLRAGTPGAGTDRTMTALQAAALLGGFTDPVVSIGQASGTGAGLDVVVGTDEEVQGLVAAKPAATPWSGVGFVAPGPGRSAQLVVSGATVTELEANLAQLVAAAENRKPVGSPSGLSALSGLRGQEVEGRQSLAFGDLGIDARPFSGRLFREDITFSLPADFYSADYDSASLRMNAAYAAGLSSEAVLLVRANDRIVATLPLSSPRAGQLRDHRLRVPLDTLKSGTNRLSLEAFLPRPEDTACEPAAERPARFVLSGSTRLEFPALARAGHYPDLAGTLAGVKSEGHTSRDLALYLPGGDARSLDAASTLVARMATGSGSVRRTRLVSAMPHEESGDLLAVGTYASLPGELVRAVRLRAPGEPEALVSSSRWLPVASAEAAAPSPAAPALSGDGQALSAFIQPVAYRERLAEIGRQVAGPVLDSLHRIVNKDRSEERAPLPEGATILAQAPAPVATGAAWTLLAAPTGESLAHGLDRLVENQTWTGVNGARVEIPDASDRAIVSASGGSERLFETQPRSLSNARLVLAGWFSRHSDNYASFVLSASLLLALSTWLLLRRLGEKDK